MRVLLDTVHIHRLMAAHGGFPTAERDFITRHRAVVYASTTSLWEMRLKFLARDATGRRKSPHDPQQVWATLTRLGVPILTVTPDHVVPELRPSLGHKDPFDELLLLQAQEEGLRLLTTDRLLLEHPLAVSLRDRAGTP